MNIDENERLKTWGIRELVDPLASICAADFADKPPEPRGWLVPDLIPARNVTDLSGDGGNGKSLLALQLAVATVTGTDWIGTMPEPGPALYLSCEDELPEIQRRVDDICRSKEIAVSDLAGMHIADLTQAAETELMAPSKRGLAQTRLFERLRLKLAYMRPKLVVLDTRADLFGGNEIDRVQVRTFVRTLRCLCFEYDTALLMLSHPSVAGMSSGTGQSGSTAWNASVRSRLYLERAKDSEGNADPSLRVLECKKSNYAPVDRRITLVWRDGVFRPDGSRPGFLDKLALEKTIDDAFMRHLREFTLQGRHVSDSRGANYAPHCFADADGKIGKRAFKAAMERQFKAGAIAIERTGPQSRQVKRIVEVE